jgi:IS30 family transposase
LITAKSRTIIPTPISRARYSCAVSHETIDRTLFIQARGALKQELIQHLRSKRRIRRSRHSSVHGHSRGQIVDAISIRERPAEAEDRAVPGHWEGDLLAGADNTYVVTLVERLSRFCMLRKKVADKDSATVVAALIQQIGPLPADCDENQAAQHNQAPEEELNLGQ